MCRTCVASWLWLGLMFVSGLAAEEPASTKGTSNKTASKASLSKEKGTPLRETAKTAVAAVEAHAKQLTAINHSVWEFAEVGLQETKSATLLTTTLKEAGFQVKENVAGMPTAFVASFGEGKPVIGILAEYDALPGLSQKVSAKREAATEGAPGHGCGHSGLGAAAVGAAIAVKETMEKHKLPGTIRLYGTPAEETVIGKIYMAIDGAFDDLDVCLHWHPSDKNESWAGSSKAIVSAKFTFHGTTAHAAIAPDRGRSALDAVELMNIGANFMREHIKEDARVHYVVTDGGGAPNVVPAKATVWYFVRADAHEDVEKNFAWLQDIAKGAALMTRTKMTMQIDTDCHEIIANGPLAAKIHDNLVKIGAPKFTDEEHAFAKQLQAPLVAEFGGKFSMALDERIHRVPAAPTPSRGSTDVGDVSWMVPTGGLHTTCFVSDSPGHSWQNVATIGSSIGDKGLVYAAKVLAVTGIDLLEDPKLVAAAKVDFKERMEGRKYTSLIPKGQPAPKQIR